ncbi:MAG: hypothetical protein LBQ44_08825 [Treponema sp.]|jgi:hypothetical protein|nr:hypothetical protein [Treponema sp.]
MKKNLLLVLALFIAGGVFAQEYTIYLAGTLRGFITVRKERGGKITIAPSISSGGWVWIGNAVCPLLPKDGFTIRKTTKSIVIDGNTTTESSADGKWNKTVIDGNTTTYTTSEGYWAKTVNEGNTITFTSSRGNLAITVLDGNTLTKTYPNDTLTVTHYDPDGKRTSTGSYESWWQKVVVSGNIMTETDSSGSWSRAVINGNTTTVTKDGSLSYEEVIRGNTRTLTYSYGGGYREVVDGNTITITSLDGKRKEVIDKQGNDIFLTLTGAYGFNDIGISEKDRVKSTIDGITSGRLEDGKFYELIDYGR